MRVAKLNDNGEEIGAMEIATVEDTADMVSKALRKAWFLGQTYWQQADSESWSQNKKSAGTQEKFQQLVDETRAAILETPNAKSEPTARLFAQRPESEANGVDRRVMPQDLTGG